MEARVLERQPASALNHAQSAAVTAELARVLQSEPFKGSARQRKFLSVIVDWTLRGKADEIKETTLAVMVFGRHPSSFDAQRDPIVRVEAARIRKNLELFYAGAGAASPVRIAIPKGHYRPTFFDPASEAVVAESNSANSLATQGERVIVASNRRHVLTHDAHARDCFCRGQYALLQLDAAMHAKAIELFRKAIAADPGFAQAHASLAITLLSLTGFVSSLSGPLAAEALVAAQHAIALDPTTADAYIALAANALRFEWDWPKAERLYRRALELAPASAISHAAFGHALTTRARFSEATKHLRYARELDPLNVMMRAASAQTLYYQRRYVEADTELTALLEIAPKHAFAERMLGLNFLYRGKPQAARAAFVRASANLPDHPSPQILIAAALAMEGREGEARDHLSATLTRFADHQYYCRYHLAIAYAYLRDRGGLYQALDQAAQERDFLVVSLPVEPAFDAYHADARFRSFLAAHRLPTLEACAQAA